MTYRQLILSLNFFGFCDKKYLYEKKEWVKPLLHFGRRLSMDRLKEWIEPLLEQQGCRLYDLEWLTNEKPPLLRISIEKIDGPVDLDACAACSDVIGNCLDEKDWYAKEYNLEVCSPGAERELKTYEQIQNAIGSYVYVKLKNPKQGLDHVLGDLKEADDQAVTIQYKDKTRNKEISIDKENISLIMTAVKL